MGKVVSKDNNGKIVLVEVEDEIARVINNEDCKFRKKSQYHGYCSCEFYDAWKCIGDCPTCEYFCEGKMKHFDSVFDDTNTDLWNTLVITNNIPERIIVNSEFFKEILDEIKDDAPDIYELGLLLESGMSISKAAKRLGIKRTTLNSRREKLKSKIYKKYGNIFRQK